ncbi:hypothetical protein C5167_030192 [Papaver somniferum]|nr:hypothetical protein C5167_030192 [Papaver somniferum]
MAFDLLETSKSITVKGMSDPWRRFKCELREDHYDIWNIHQERIDNGPPNVNSEDWISFCVNEDDAEVQSKRAINKRKREQYDYSHTSGRKPHCLVRSELEKLTKMLEDIKGKQEAGTPVEETCAVTSLFGKDSRGRVRVVGPVSRTQVDLFASARGKVAELKYQYGVLNSKVEDLGVKVKVLIEGVGSLCHGVKDIQDAMSSSVFVSNMCSTSQGHVGSPQSGSVARISSPGHAASPGHALSRAAQTSSPGHALSPALSAAGMQQCSLLNMDDDIIAIGKFFTCTQGLMAHDSVVHAIHLKVLIDDILLPDERTVKANKFAETFRDVGIGVFVVHPKRPDVVSYIAIVDTLCKGGLVDEALVLFSEMIDDSKIVPNVVSYNTLINGFGNSNRLIEAKRLLEVMASRLQEAIKLFDSMVDRGLEPTEFHYNVLLDGYGKNHKMDEPMQLFKKMKQNGLRPTAFTYTSLLAGLYRDGRMKTAKNLFNEMQTFSLSPDQVVCNAVIVAGIPTTTSI